MAKKRASGKPMKQKGRTDKAQKASERPAIYDGKGSELGSLGGPLGQSERVPGFTEAIKEVLRETSYKLEIPVSRLEIAIAAARLEPEAFDVVEKLVSLVSLDEEGKYEERLKIALKTISESLDRFVLSDEDPEDPEDPLAEDTLDPLAVVDETSEREILLGHIEAEIKTSKLRRMILASCIGVEDASRIAERTRQRLEALRRKGKVLALRVRNRWRYPRWQFDPDYSGGVVPGLGEVLTNLQLSPAGSAAWLTTVFKSLGNHAPIELLRAGRPDEVIELAKEHGYLP